MLEKNRTRFWRTLLFVALGGLLVLAWTQRDRFTPVDAGSRAPAYVATTLKGGTFSVEASRGKVVVLNVWATWCKPCRKEMPALERLHQKLGSRGLEVIGVSTDAAASAVDPFGRPGSDVREFVEQLGLTFPIIHDAERTIERLYLVQGLPTTFVIDRKGRIDKKVLGAKEWDDAEHVAYFESLLGES